MPRKLCHYVPKNPSTKGKENAPKLSNLTSLKVKNVLFSGKIYGTNTVSVSVQTDLQLSIFSNKIDTAVQTEHFTIHCKGN